MSVGDYDFVKQVQEELGVERRFWGVRTKPGKPLAFGVRGETPVFGVPGNPVAAMVTFEVFVRPLLLSMLGRQPHLAAVGLGRGGGAGTRYQGAAGAAPLPGCAAQEERWVFTTTGPQGSAVLSSMALANGLVLVPTGFAGADAGEPPAGDAAQRLRRRAAAVSRVTAAPLVRRSGSPGRGFGDS